MLRRILILLLVCLPACNLNRPSETTPTPEAVEPSPTDEPTATPVPAQPIQLTDVVTPVPPIPGTPRAAPTLPLIPQMTATLIPVGVRPEDVTATPNVLPTGISPTPDIVFPQNYPDRYEVSVSAGQTIVVNYDVVINNPGRGRVFMVVRDPAGQDIWRLVVTETMTDSEEVPASRGGTHVILVAVENLNGRYSVSFGRR